MEKKTDAAAIAEREALIDPLYILSMNEEAMEEAIEHFDGSSTGEALKCVLHAQKEIRAALAATDAIAPTEGAVHLDEWWVDLFAKEMKAKLENARAKGRGGWQDCDPTDLSRMLREHVEKGDPRDVANFCMFLWALRSPISAAPSPKPAVDALTLFENWWHEGAHNFRNIGGKKDLQLTQDRAQVIWQAAVDALTTGAVEGEPVAWARPDLLERLGSPIAYSAVTELLKKQKDGYMPLYAHPASEPKALTKVMIGKAWRNCGALSDSPPDWALAFAQNILRALLADRVS